MGGQVGGGDHEIFRVVKCDNLALTQLRIYYLLDLSLLKIVMTRYMILAVIIEIII